MTMDMIWTSFRIKRHELLFRCPVSMPKGWFTRKVHMQLRQAQVEVEPAWLTNSCEWLNHVSLSDRVKVEPAWLTNQIEWLH